jgi:hypothetical protein
MSAIKADQSAIDPDVLTHDGPPPAWLQERIVKSLAEIESGAVMDADEYQRILEERLLRDEAADLKR